MAEIEERFVCTAENPWSKEKAKRAMHPDAKLIAEFDGWPAGDVEAYECPHCGLYFKVELPQ